MTETNQIKELKVELGYNISNDQMISSLISF